MPKRADIGGRIAMAISHPMALRFASQAYWFKTMLSIWIHSTQQYLVLLYHEHQIYDLIQRLHYGALYHY
jgi:hypothetical protein